MSTMRTIASVCAWAVPAVCMAGAPAGPAAADEILRQNPQIKTLSGVPGNLKGASVQDCPRGGNPDISRNRCVVAYVPSAKQAFQSNYGVVQSFVLVLHPNSSRVWGVFKNDASKPGRVDLLGEFDLNDRLVSQSGAVARSKKGGAMASAAAANATSPPATQQLPAVQSGQVASGQTDKQRSFDQQWFGKWQGTEKSSSLEISSNIIRYKHLAGDEGVYRPVMTLCKWSPTKDALRDMGTGDCRFSYSQETKSKEEIAPAFEKLAREYCSKNATVGFWPDGKPIACGAKGDRITVAFNKSRKALAAMKPGMHNFLLLNDAGDVSELILDGENILRISPDYGGIRYIELFTRVVSGKPK